MPLRTPVAVAFALLAALGPASAPPARAADDAARAGARDDDRFEKLPREDRAALDELVGFVPPKVPETITMIGGARPDWPALRGKVVLVQSYSTGSGAGRRAPEQLAKALEGATRDDVVVLLLHTPENAHNAEKYLERKPVAWPTMLDADGAYCDALGVWKRPVNLVIDRAGEVRHAGVRMEALGTVLDELRAEPFDPERKPRERPVATAVAWPPCNESITTAKDVRGQAGPAFHVQQWLTRAPELQDRVVMVDFWATWCGPCVASIPHLVGLTNALGADVAIVGLTDEQRGDVDRAIAGGSLSRFNTAIGDWPYAMAIDPSARMKKALQIRAIPHCIVMSRDGVVRWQGHPARLDEATLKAIVAADKAAAGQPAAGGRRRWTK